MTIGKRRNMSRGFTLIELLVVIGVIAILITLTVVAVAGIATDAKLATGKNRVISALGTARAMAMENNRPTGVVCMVQWDPATPQVRQQTILYIAEWSGRAFIDSGFLINEYNIVNGIEPLILPPGIKVAGPWYNRDGFDDTWISQPQFPQSNPVGGIEAAGRVVAVLFSASGEVITDVPEADSNYRFLDLDNDHQQDTGATGSNRYWYYDEPGDEVNIEWVPFIAVYNDDEAREFQGPSDWGNEATRDAQLTAYINQFADRIHFNRYTGVAMR